jgi:hypothetical protein
MPHLGLNTLHGATPLMLKAYLLVNGVLYVIFALWCTFMPEKTAGYLGFAFKSGSGKSEYMTVYGGLEFGIALFFLAAGLKPELAQAGLLFALMFYGSLAVWRIYTFITVADIQKPTYYFGTSEIILAIMAAALYVFKVN